MSSRTTVAPLLLGPANAAAATGASWRWVRDTAAVLGVRFVGAGRKRFVPAADFLAALERTRGESEPPEAEISAADRVLVALGRAPRTVKPLRTAGNSPDGAELGPDYPERFPSRAAERCR